jgi:hypothetical protein
MSRETRVFSSISIIRALNLIRIPDFVLRISAISFAVVDSFTIPSCSTPTFSPLVAAARHWATPPDPYDRRSPQTRYRFPAGTSRFAAPVKLSRLHGSVGICAFNRYAAIAGACLA